MLDWFSNVFAEIEEGKKFSALIKGIFATGLIGVIVSAFLAGIFYILPGEDLFLRLLINMFMWFGGTAPAYAIVLFCTNGNDPFEWSAVVIYYLSLFVTNWLGGSYPWSFLTILVVSMIYGAILSSNAKRKEEERELNFLRYENKILKERLEEYEKNKHRRMDGKTE